MAELEKTTIADINDQILKLLAKKDELNRQARELAIKEANSMFNNKWVLKNDGLYKAYYHIISVDEVCDHLYQRGDEVPIYRCTCDCSFSFTYFNGIRVYREAVTETLQLGGKTIVCAPEQLQEGLERLTREMTETVNEFLRKPV